MGIQIIFQVLRTRYMVLVIVFSLAMLGGLITNLVVPSKYTSTASVLIDSRLPDPLVGSLATPMNYMSTQADIIGSERVARKVVKQLKLDESQAVRNQWQDETGGRETLMVWLGKLIGRGLSVKTSQDTNVVNISYTATEASFSALVANAFAQSYIETNIELKVEPARQYAAWFQERTKELRADLEKAQTRLADYQQENHLFDANERQSPTDEHSKIYELSKHLTDTEAQTADTQSRRKQVGSADAMPDVMKSTIVQNLKEKIITQEAKLQELKSTLGQNHPQYQTAEDQIAVLKRRLNEESRNVLNSVNTANVVNKQKEAELSAAIEAHKKQAVEDRAKLDQVAVLQRDVAAAQKAYDVVVQHFTDSNLQSQSNQTDISMLNPASPPIERTTPQMQKNFIKAAVAGLMLGLVLIAAWEIIDTRVRSAEMLGTATGVPMLVDFSQKPVSAGWKNKVLKMFDAFMLKVRLKKNINAVQ